VVLQKESQEDSIAQQAARILQMDMRIEVRCYNKDLEVTSTTLFAQERFWIEPPSFA
jgi:hypothetical protein